MSLVRTFTRATGVALATVALVAPAAQAAPAPSTATSPEPMIIDGRYAESTHGAARLFQNGRQACSATIIAERWILTAQHCVEGAENALSFHIGSLDQTQGETARGVQVEVHPRADLALVKIDQAVQTEYAPLGSSGDVRVGETVQTFGWGATCTDRPEIECQSRRLKVADVTVTDTRCSDYRGGTAVCARRGDGIPAGGDSGGPMFAEAADGEYVQVGVASTSDRSSRTAYTNVTQYRDWISSVAGV